MLHRTLTLRILALVSLLLGLSLSAAFARPAQPAAGDDQADS